MSERGSGAPGAVASALRRVPPAALVFAAALVALFVLRGRALSTPYFWDEIGYYVPNAVSMYRNRLYPIPTLTVPQSYPPLQPLTLVAGWWLLGFSIAATRVVGFVTTAAAVAATFELGRRSFSTAAGAWAAVLTLASPVFFGQAGFAQPEILLALFTTLATLELVRGSYARHATAVALLLMTKWTAIVVLPVFGLYALLTAATWREGLKRQLWYAPALALLALWLGFFYVETGSLTSTDAHYARVNLWDNLTPAALLFRGAVRLEQLVENDYAWLLLAPALAASAVWCRGRRRPAPVVLLMVGACLAYVAFLTVSGFLLPRYFVPVLPLFSALGAASVLRLASRPVATAALAAAALFMHLSWYGRLQTGPALLDARTAYMDFVDTHVLAARWIEANRPGARVAAAWPAFDELHEPYFGYVTRPANTVALDTLPPDASALDRFDVLVETPIPQNPDPAAEVVRRLGLVEIARFREGEQETILWARPQESLATPPPLY
jgi:4-amino-4-deoxy-L-arabinose transferase-like glycosyltransferase